MTGKKPSPSIGQLKAWRADEVTDWVIRQLVHRYPDYRSLFPIQTPERLAVANHAAGSRSVLESIEKLVEHGEC